MLRSVLQMQPFRMKIRPQSDSHSSLEYDLPIDLKGWQF